MGHLIVTAFWGLLATLSLIMVIVFRKYKYRLIGFLFLLVLTSQKYYDFMNSLLKDNYHEKPFRWYLMDALEVVTILHIIGLIYLLSKEIDKHK